MRRFQIAVLLCFLSVVGVMSLAAQVGEGGAAGMNKSVPAPSVGPRIAPATASVLRLIKFSGSAINANGQPMQGTVGITFALYADQQGGSPLWLETQNATLDNQGRYTALLGAMSNEGLPLEIFTSGEARWLGITVQGQAEQPRVLLVAVPYALKAAEAETLSGMKASDFVTTAQLPEQMQKVMEGQQAESSNTTSESNTTTSGDGAKAAVLAGATNFTDNTTDQVVKVTQNGTGYALLGVGVNSNGVFGATQAASSNVYGIFGQTIGTQGGAMIGFANSTTGTAVGVQGVTKSAGGTAGAFVNTGGGTILLGRGAGSAEIFRVDGQGTVSIKGPTSSHIILRQPTFNNLADVAVIDFLEDTGPFGSDANGGFRLSYDGSGNVFTIASGNSGGTHTHITMPRGSSDVELGGNLQFSDGTTQSSAPLWAVVASDGTLDRGHGVSSASLLSTGQYEVIFTRDVTACTYVATLGGTTTSTPTGQISVARRSLNANGVFLRTMDSSGTNTSLSFHLAVFC